jgi:hypothetical protein
LPLVSLRAHLSFLDWDTLAEFSQPCKPNFLVSIPLPQSLGCVSSPGRKFVNPCITAHFVKKCAAALFRKFTEGDPHKKKLAEGEP